MYRNSHGNEKGNRQTDPYPSGSKVLEQIISMDECAKHIIDTAISRIQKQLLDKTKQGGPQKLVNPSLGFKRNDLERAAASLGAKFPNVSPSRRGGWQESQPQEPRKEDFSSLLTSTIQKVMREAVNNTEENPNSPNRSRKQGPLTESRSQKIKALPKLTIGNREPNGSMNPMEMLDIDQLVKSMTKLCLLESGGNNSSNLASGDTFYKQFGSSSHQSGGPKRTSVVRPNMKPSGSNGVIVTNQNGESGSLNKELQAILQWMVASQFNVPNLTFLNDREGELSELPRLAQKATNKGYSVGDILHKVMVYLERAQMEESMGKRPPCGLIRWLHANL